MLALELHEADTCPCGCGQQMTRSHHWDQEGAYDVVTTVCHAGAARAQWEAQEGKNAGPGTIPIVVEIDPERELRPLTVTM